MSAFMADYSLSALPAPYTGTDGLSVAWSCQRGDYIYFLADEPTLGGKRPDEPDSAAQAFRTPSANGTNTLSHVYLQERKRDKQFYLAIVGWEDLTIKGWMLLNLDSVLVDDKTPGEVFPIINPSINISPDSRIQVTPDHAHAMVYISCNNILSKRISLLREDPIFGQIFLRGLKRYNLINETTLEAEDGEVPLDTPLTYILVEHFEQDVNRRPPMQRNLIKNPSFEIDLSGWNFYGRSASKTTLAPLKDVKGVWADPGFTPVNADVNVYGYVPGDPAGVLVDRLDITAADDRVASVTSPRIAIPGGERYFVDIPILQSYGTRYLKMTVYFEDQSGPVTLPAGEASSETIIPRNPASGLSQSLSLEFNTPVNTTHLAIDLEFFSTEAAQALGGDTFSIPMMFTLEDKSAQEVTYGQFAATVSDADGLTTTLKPLPATSPFAATTKNVYLLAQIPTPDGGIKPETQYQVTGSIITVKTVGGEVPVTWTIAEKMKFGTWDTPSIPTATWDSVEHMRYPVQDEAQVFLVALDAAGAILDAVPLGQAHSVFWLMFSRRYTPPAGTTSLAIAHEETNEEGTDTALLSWRLDSFMLEHELFTGHRLPYLDGDVTIPAAIAQYPVLQDTFGRQRSQWVIKWDGEPHKSTSTLYPPANLQTLAQRTMVISAIGQGLTDMDCVSIHLADPMLPRLGVWAIFAALDSWEHPARLEKLAVINRYTPIAINDMRMSMTNTISLITKTQQQRIALRRLLQSGRTLILQFPRNRENSWNEFAFYIAIDSVTESFIGSDMSRPERRWELPFQVVTRPVGVLRAQALLTWDRVKAATETLWADWDEVMVFRSDWYDLMTNDPLNSNATFASPISGGVFPIDTSTSGVVVPKLGFRITLGNKVVHPVSATGPNYAPIKDLTGG